MHRAASRAAAAPPLPPTLSRPLLLALLLLLGALALLTPASAQVIPSVVEEIKVVSEDENESRFMIRFSPHEPQFAPVNVSPSSPQLLMRATLRAPRVPERSRLTGLVRNALFQTSETGLLLRFETAAPARLTAQKAGAKSIQVIVTRLSDAEATGIRPIGSRPEEVAPATELPQYVDYNPGDAYELVFLKYADVSEVVGLLVPGQTIQPNNIFIRREPGFGSIANINQPNYVSPQNQAQAESVPLGQSVGNGLAVDRRLNAIWVTGSPERIAQVKQQIALIDVPVDSVILETQFVELTEQGARNLGFDFNNSAGQIATGSLARGSNIPIDTPFQVGRRTFLPSVGLQAAIYAQIQKGEGRIVSRPRIAAQSGSTAKIITGDAIPITTTVLSGLNNVSQQVQYVNVGVTLQIAPRVSSDGFVTSQIYGVVSSVTGYSQGYPTISQREAETSASVRDGETFVIGGLTQENAIAINSKVPLLGDIPLVGQAFRLNRSTRAKTELYIVITPHIVRHRRGRAPGEGVSAVSPIEPNPR